MAHRLAFPGGTPRIWQEGHEAIVQGQIHLLVTSDGTAGGAPTGEAQVAVPVATLRQAVLSQATGYQVTISGYTYTVHSDDVRVIFPQ